MYIGLQTSTLLLDSESQGDVINEFQAVKNER